MAWLRIDDGFAEHRKIDKLSDRAFRVHVSALCLCARKLTDGHVDHRDVRSLLARIGATKRHVNELESARIWVTNGSGYVIRDYLDYNPSAEQVLEERKAAAVRMKAKREAERSAKRSGERSGEVTANVRGPRPVPSLEQPPSYPSPDLEQPAGEGRTDFQEGDFPPTRDLPKTVLRDMPA